MTVSFSNCLRESFICGLACFSLICQHFSAPTWVLQYKMILHFSIKYSLYLWGKWQQPQTSERFCTCFHGRGRHRRQSCSAAGWGQSWPHSPPSPADRSGNINADGSPEHRSERSTRPRQTPDQDWTSPVGNAHKHCCHLDWWHNQRLTQIYTSFKTSKYWYLYPDTT